MIRLLFIVAFLQVFFLQNSFAFDEDKENKNPPLSPQSKLDKTLSPVRRKLALKRAIRGSVSPRSIRKAYEEFAPDLIKDPVWFDPLLFNKDESLPKMEQGKSGVSYNGELMELHHLFQTDDSPVAYFPKSIHRSLGARYIVVKKALKPQKAKIVKTRLTRKEAHNLQKTSPLYVVESNSLHPYGGESLINRNSFNSRRRYIAKKVARKLKEDINQALAPLG